MKKKIDFRIPIIIILIFILTVMCIFYFKNDSTNVGQSKSKNKAEKNTPISSNTTETSTTSLSTTAEVTSALTEKIELHATYYLEECYVEGEQNLTAGENILKYTNGTYLTAPYDCVIKTINVPEAGSKCTNEHYIEIESTTLLDVKFKVDETNINKISLGQEAQIEISAFDDKTLTGNVTNITNTASNGKFTVTVQFENDGEVMLGMSAKVSV